MEMPYWLLIIYVIGFWIIVDLFNHWWEEHWIKKEARNGQTRR